MQSFTSFSGMVCKHHVPLPLLKVHAMYSHLEPFPRKIKKTVKIDYDYPPRRVILPSLQFTTVRLFAVRNETPP